MRVVGSWVFFVDEGAVYDVTFYGDGTGTVTGRRSAVVYTSKDHSIKITGKLRRQATGTGRVDGRRAVLILDTGEGLSILRGVAV